MALATYFKYYRLARAGMAALFLLAAIVVMKWAGSGPPPSRERITGTITRVLESPVGTDQQRLTLVQLPDGREGRVLVPVYLAVFGREVPLLVESQGAGTAYIAFDEAQWLDSAGP